MQQLLAAGVDPNIETKLGQTALTFAAVFAAPEVVQVLIEAGTDLTKIDQAGWTPLNHALAWGNTDTAELLLKAGVDPNVVDKRGQTALDQCQISMPNLEEALNEFGNKLKAAGAKNG